MTGENKFILSAFVYFLLAALLTAIYISQKIWLYSNVTAMVISGTITAVKWIILVVAALFFLEEKKWKFIRRIGVTCLIGSSLLFSYNLMYFLKLPLSGLAQLFLSVVLSASVMITLYHLLVKEMVLPPLWFWGWIIALTIESIVQVVVFF